MLYRWIGVLQRDSCFINHTFCVIFSLNLTGTQTICGYSVYSRQSLSGQVHLNMKVVCFFSIQYFLLLSLQEGLSYLIRSLWLLLDELSLCAAKKWVHSAQCYFSLVSNAYIVEPLHLMDSRRRPITVLRKFSKLLR